MTIKNTIILFFGCLFVLSSCTSDDNSFEIETMKVNHFRQSGNGLLEPYQFLLVQKGDDFGSQNWNLFYNGIEGFNYELGYVYTLKVEKENIKNPPMDGSSVRYTLLEEISKEKAPSDLSFEILLSRTYDDGYFEPFFNKIDNSTFELLDGTQINCANLCDELTEKIGSKEPMIGVFQHSENNSLEITELK